MIKFVGWDCPWTEETACAAELIILVMFQTGNKMVSGARNLFVTAYLSDM